MTYGFFVHKFKFSFEISTAVADLKEVINHFSLFHTESLSYSLCMWFLLMSSQNVHFSG